MSPPPRPVAPLDLDLPAVVGSVQAARHAVAAFCVGQTLDHGGIAIAVAEAVANVVTPTATGPADPYASSPTWSPDR